MRHAKHSASPFHNQRQESTAVSGADAAHGSHGADTHESASHTTSVFQAGADSSELSSAIVEPSRETEFGAKAVGRHVREMQVDQALADKLNEFVPQTRRSIRMAAKAQRRRAHLLASASLAALVSTAATAMAFSHPKGVSSSAGDSQPTTTQLRRTASTDVSRSSERESLQTGETSTTGQTTQTTSTGSWQLTDSGEEVDTNSLSRSKASNPQVAIWMDEDASYLPSGFNPDHETGDTGNAYAFSQCTWWVYLRRQQLGLPVGSHMGNGAMWADSARELGYWVDHTARHVGDILVFSAGQYGSSAVYGHVAVIEKINADGSVETSESGAVHQGKTVSRTFTDAQVATLQVIHY